MMALLTAASSSRVSPMVLLPALGNAQQNTNWLITGHAGGNYFWNDQTLDNNFAGSLLCDLENFVVSSAATDDYENSNQAAVLTNVPNPFTDSTRISFHLTESGYVQLDIFNINGQLVNSLMKRDVSAGHHSFEWGGLTTQGNPVDAGLYYYQLTVNNKVRAAEKCLLLE